MERVRSLVEPHIYGEREQMQVSLAEHLYDVHSEESWVIDAEYPRFAVAIRYAHLRERYVTHWVVVWDMQEETVCWYETVYSAWEHIKHGDPISQFNLDGGTLCS